MSESNSSSIIKRCIEMNRAIRSEVVVTNNHSRTRSSLATPATLDKEKQRIEKTIFKRSSIESLYLIPEIAICVDFWRSAMKTKTVSVESADRTFASAFEKYITTYEQVPGKTLVDLFNDGVWDYLFYGTEPIFVDARFVDVDGFRFPRSIIPLKFSESKLKEYSRTISGIEYSADPVGGALIANKDLIVCKRISGIHDTFGVPFVARAINPVYTQMSDSELDAALTKMGIMSSFVLIKYGTEKEPRDQDELAQLHEELQQSIKMGVGIGVVPADVSIEKVFASGSNAFNRDKIFETHFKSIDIAFGGVLTIISPRANLGSAANNVVMGLHALIEGEREERKNKILNAIARRVAKLNTQESSPTIALSEIEFSMTVTQENRLKEYDRGMTSYKTYMGNKYDTEISRIKEELDGNGDRKFLVPRELPYNKPASKESDSEEPERKDKQDEQG